MESRIVKQIKKRKLDSLMRWIDKRKSRLYKIGWSYLKCHQDVEDVFQNTILIVFEKINQLKEEQYFETWVTTIFINECRGIYRKKSRREPEPTDLVDDMKADEIRIEVFDILNQIEETYKEVIILKYISDYTIEEVSRILNIPSGTVKSRLYRGLKMLKSEMERGEM